MTDVFLAGAGMTRFGRRAESLEALAREAAHTALADAGEPDVAHVFCGLQDPEGFLGEGNASTLVTEALGLAGAAATRVESGPSSGASALEAAWFAVKSGAVRTALVVGAEKMTHAPRAQATRVLSRMLHARERALGLTMPAFAALATRRYMWRYGLTREDLAVAPVLAHRGGARHARAQFRNAITVADVVDGPAVADPLTVFDCAPVSDGAAAVVLTSRPGPVRVAGIGHATDNHAVGDRADPDALTAFRATRDAAARAYALAGKRPGDVDVAEVHDAFSILAFTNLEDLGFVKPGAARDLVVKGETDLGGRLPVNVGGGLKARGHPVGATGVAQAVEVFEQLTRTAGARQVDGARVGLTHNVGGFGSNVVVSVMEVAE